MSCQRWSRPTHRYGGQDPARTFCQWPILQTTTYVPRSSRVFRRLKLRTPVAFGRFLLAGSCPRAVRPNEVGLVVATMGAARILRRILAASLLVAANGVGEFLFTL